MAISRKAQYYIFSFTVLSLGFLSLFLITSQGNPTESKMNLRKMVNDQTEETVEGVNLILESNYSSRYLEEELTKLIEMIAFQDKQKKIETNRIFLIGVPTVKNNQINLTIGNFYKRTINISIKAFNQTKESKIGKRELKRVIMPLKEDNYQLKLNYSDRSRSLNLSKKVFVFQEISYKRNKQWGTVNSLD